MTDFPELPDFLNRKLNGVKPDPLPTWAHRQLHSGGKLAWPKKRTWRKIEARRKAREKKEGTALALGAFIPRKGQ